MRLRSVQALRGVAAGGVLLFHLFGSAFHSGQAGVDLFFVISGFIIGSVDPTQRPLSFLSKRAVRIVPLYWLVTLAMCAAWFVPGLYNRFVFTAETLVKSLLFVPYFNQDGQIWPLLVPGWTLNYEVLFYVVFAVGLAMRRPFATAAVILGGAVVAGLVVQPGGAILQTWTSPLLLEFLAGLIIAARKRTLGWRTGALLVLAGLAAFVVPLLVGISVDRNSAWLTALLWGGPSALLLAGVVAIERDRGWSAFIRPAERLGDISYSLYLTHVPVIAVGARLFPQGVLRPLLTAALCIAIAAASYALVERGLSDVLRRWVTEGGGRSRRNTAESLPD